MTTPPGREVDPGEETTDTVIDNDFMSSSRTKSASSRSVSNGSSGTGGTGEDVPLPADTIGKPKDESSDGERQGGREEMTSGGTDWFAGRAGAQTQTREPAPTTP